MAEIKIEKKTPIWPWILALVLLIAILVYIFAFNDIDEEADEKQETTTEQTIEESEETKQIALNNSEVSAYVSFIKEDPYPMGLDHEFTNEALLKLINATTAIANEVNYDIQKDIEQVRTYSEKVTSNPFETTHANSIRKATEILANVLHNIQQYAFIDLTSEATEVKNAAMAIKPDIQTLNQKHDVKNFFRQSADLLEKMNTNSPKNVDHVK